MGFKEGFDTTIGIIFALLSFFFICVVIISIPSLFKFLYPKIKWFASIHPIISFIILIVGLCVILQFFDGG